MQDRFRFRVWCVNKKQWEEGRTYLDNQGCLYDDFRRVKEETHIIQQCTGLKDVSGQLIYEGDIVLFGPNPDDIAVIEWDKDECKFIVDEIFNNARSDFSNWFGEDLEIIGNTYEDPDLIGGKKQ